ncbi:helix-turn-helix domain-containing protein [Longimicrobium terrae]|uniref:Putative XRE-type DNA-binding protein n=1 Tax=Longimicrobium terrae TaxID=1639882 RepID=A0A841GN55_9BACT|nr:helix-turn-helix transcriptional regulator [Longimicrobium terrae]MBB4635673.1 putative XRE-type DNA-binding protein [Longimicrobium terrae]MBB6070067.1 putative XRE-type DNA-binding protein [Longimicrobium terrae]NNC32971.1 XRE family transcriptional regulator [Longimicrobium terrae]
MIGHVTPADANIFADLGFEPIEAASLFLRSQLMRELVVIMRQRELKQQEAAALFGVSQPRVSELKRGKIDSFTIDSLVNMLAHAGMEVRVSLKKADEPRVVAPEVEEEWPEPEHALG